MSAPTHVEVTINAMKQDGPGFFTLAERGDKIACYDVEARRVETDTDHPDWTGAIHLLEDVECATYDEAVAVAEKMCATYGLPADAWDEEGG